MAEPRKHRGSAIQWPSPSKARGPPVGSPTARFFDILRRFEVFGGSNDLRILRNKNRCVRIEDSFATVQESRSYDFGASRKAPKTKGSTPERTKRRRLADPRAPQQGSSAMRVGHG